MRKGNRESFVESGRGTTSGAPVRVLAVDFDGGAASRTLSRDPNIELLAVRSFAAANEALGRFAPDAVVVALGAPRPSEIAELRAVVQSAPNTPLLVTSSPAGERRVTEVIKAGASGYLFSDDSGRLSAAIREVIRGGAPMSRTVSRLVLGRARRSSAKMAAVRPRTESAETLLTPRQREILTLLARGLSYDDVARVLGLSLNTVRTHVRMLYERLGANTKVEAVMLGMQLGLVGKVSG